MVGAFERADVDYMVVGSTAAAAWGVARTTRDIDVAALLAADQLEEVLGALEEAGLYIPTDQARATATTSGRT